MPRPTTKTELLKAASEEFARLWSALDAIDPEVREDPRLVAAIEDQSRNPRDVLCHLHSWHLLMLDWYQDGQAGRTPRMPAPGHTWRTLPALNAELWTQHRDTTYLDACALVRHSHRQVVDIIESHTDAELFIKQHYAWTGSTSLGAYLVSATSSHYVWARKTLKAITKAGLMPLSRSDSASAG